MQGSVNGFGDHDHDHDHDDADHFADRRPGAMDGPGPLSALEMTVLRALLAGDDPARVALRAQLAAATAASRTYSGVGFMTRIAVSADVPAAPAMSLRPVFATHPTLQEPAEFLLQLREGRLAVLEGYCCDGMWPTNENDFEVSAS